PSFFGLEVGLTSELRVPTLPPALKHSMPAMNVLDPREFSLVVARLKPGISLQQAQAETDVSYQRLLADHPQINADPRFHGSHLQVLPASRGSSYFQNALERPLLVLTALVGLVLLIACAD